MITKESCPFVLVEWLRLPASHVCERREIFTQYVSFHPRHSVSPQKAQRLSYVKSPKYAHGIKYFHSQI